MQTLASEMALDEEEVDVDVGFRINRSTLRGGGGGGDTASGSGSDGAGDNDADADMDVGQLLAAQTHNWDLLPARGRLFIKVVEARNLWAPSKLPTPAPSAPYCVVEFDKNEFVTREALAVNPLKYPSIDLLHRAITNHPTPSLSVPMPLLAPSKRQSSAMVTLPIQLTCIPQVSNQQTIHSLFFSSGAEYIEAGNAAPNDPGSWMCPVWRHEASFDVSRPDSEVTVSVWDRNDGGNGGGGGEVFLGMLKIVTPMIDGKPYDHWFRLMPRQWDEKIRGDIRIQLMFKTIQVEYIIE
ncbi:hypothetical protein HK100_002137 [Physocladia obscura]|uniref:C2 domain-containing protein n=1 Tax=Physocladia obscura TaxID=109957 RepID=A0AAD5SW44_9FUNG|nr:hypothetical protein HK100_002137 [Physocladia obscura]